MRGSHQWLVFTVKSETHSPVTSEAAGDFRIKKGSWLAVWDFSTSAASLRQKGC